MKKSYIVATCNTSETGVDIEIFTGSEQALAVYMLNEVTKPIDDGFELIKGADSVSDVIERNGKYTAYAAYDEFSVTCSAIENPYNSHKIEKACGNGYRITAELGPDPEYKEIIVGIDTPMGEYHQDLAVIGEKYHYEDGCDSPVPDHGNYVIRVYGDENSDDYTDKFEVKLAEYPSN